MIGKNHGIEAVRKRLQEIGTAENEPDFFGFDRLLGEPGKVYTSQAGPVEGTIHKLVAGHNSAEAQIANLKARVAALEAQPAPRPFP